VQSVECSNVGKGQLCLTIITQRSPTQAPPTSLKNCTLCPLDHKTCTAGHSCYVRTFHRLHLLRLWTPMILFFLMGKVSKLLDNSWMSVSHCVFGSGYDRKQKSVFYSRESSSVDMSPKGKEIGCTFTMSIKLSVWKSHIKRSTQSSHAAKAVTMAAAIF
jgi:hypothetical protein